MEATQLIFTNKDGSLSFGDYQSEVKQKVSDYPYNGSLYKVKTFYELTKLEKNETFVYESVPGTKVEQFLSTEDSVNFLAEGKGSTSVTLELIPETEYKVYLDDLHAGKMKTNIGGKLVLSLEFTEGTPIKVQIIKA